MQLLSIITSILCAAVMYTTVPTDLPEPADNISPDTPVIYHVRSLTSTSLEIHWKKTAGADGYKLYRSASENGKYKKIAYITDGEQLFYNDDNLTTGKTYFYRIQTVKEPNIYNEYEALSATVSGKTLPETQLYSANPTSEKKWKLKWKKVSGANGYEIARSEKKNSNYQIIQKVMSENTVNYTDNTGISGKRYYYKVRAIYTDGEITGYGNYSRAVTSNKITKSTDWKITQYGNNKGKQMMFYTIQDTHGHLIVIDGGWQDNADTVRKIISKKGGHVDAWFLTHPHPDHIGAFCEIYKKPKKISIKKVYAVKMASPKRCLAKAPWDTVDAYKQFLSLNIKQLQYVHTGDVINVGKLKIEILSAYEKKIDEISSDLLNDGSMMFKVYGKEESMLFCSDIGKQASNYLKKKYGEKLKSDYLQMGHHGNGGLKKDFYQLVNPDFAFFDAPSWLMKNKMGIYTTPQNKKYMKSLGSSVVSFSTAPNTVLLK